MKPQVQIITEQIIFMLNSCKYHSLYNALSSKTVSYQEIHSLFSVLTNHPLVLQFFCQILPKIHLMIYSIQFSHRGPVGRVSTCQPVVDCEFQFDIFCLTFSRTDSTANHISKTCEPDIVDSVNFACHQFSVTCFQNACFLGWLDRKGFLNFGSDFHDF